MQVDKMKSIKTRKKSSSVNTKELPSLEIVKMVWFSKLLFTIAIFLGSTALTTARTSLDVRDGVPYSNFTYAGQKGLHYDYTGFDSNQTRRAEAIIEMFRFAWNGYYTYAFPNDDLHPINNTYGNSRNGWGVTAIDGLDTAIIMEQTDIVNQILDFVPTIDFTKTGEGTRPGASDTVSLFETSIRYIGGLLSGYDLLKGPFSHLGVDQKKVDTLLEQCVVLADTLKFAFNTTSGISVNYIVVHNKTFATSSNTGDGT
jgi:mannosyl-oligosaccharide alpha-1,2-mannosidase